MKIPYQKSPCKECPFRKSGGVSHLGKKRAEEIIIQNENLGFVCHKTTNGKTEERRQCAGAMILARKEYQKQPFLNLYESMFGEMDLRNEDEIVDSYEEFINNQSSINY